MTNSEYSYRPWYCDHGEIGRQCPRCDDAEKMEKMKTEIMALKRDCEHGHLRRSCERCDDAAEIERLKLEVREKRDEIDSLSEQLNRVIVLIAGCGKCAGRFVKSNVGEMPDILVEVQSLRDQLTAARAQIAAYRALLADDGK